MTPPRVPGRTIHRIADIRYRPLAASSECSCGETFAATSPEALAVQWFAHRATNGGGRAAYVGNEHTGAQAPRVKPRVGNLRGDMR